MEHKRVVFVKSSTVVVLERLLGGCEQCSEGAALPMDGLLDNLTGNDPSLTAYLLQHPAICPRCYAKITEDTLIELDAAVWAPKQKCCGGNYCERRCCCPCRCCYKQDR